MPLKMYTAVTPAAVEPAKMFFTKVTPNNGANNRHACRRRATFKFVMQEDKTATEANGFYQRLHRHSALYRMILARPFAPDLILDTWYRIDLELVSELGLSLKGETAKSCRMILTCELHAQQEGEGLLRQVKDYQIEIRPLQLSAWDNVENAPETPGFHNSGLGGLEVKVLGNRQHLTKTKYFLRIFPTFSSYQTYNAIPLTIGPLEITNQASSTLGWDMDTRCKDLHRIYCLERLVQQQQQQFPSAATFSPLLNKYFLIKEGWNDGTPGKIWDSALVLSDMLAKKIARAPDCLENRHIIDLSAGTGCVGLLLGVVLKYLNPTHHARITLTDLPEALGLLKHNMKTNFNNKPDSRIGVSALTWGNQSDASKVLARGKADIILASDVLYQPKLFPALIKSLVHLSTPGKTVIYLGYKRRGLQEADEKDFFDRAGKHFHIDVLQRDIEEYQHPVEWEKSVGFVEKDHGDLDGIGWLGRNACSRSEEVVFGGYSKESGVTVYRLVPKT